MAPDHRRPVYWKILNWLSHSSLYHYHQFDWVKERERWPLTRESALAPTPSKNPNPSVRRSETIKFHYDFSFEQENVKFLAGFQPFAASMFTLHLRSNRDLF